MSNDRDEERRQCLATINHVADKFRDVAIGFHRLREYANSPNCSPAFVRTTLAASLRIDAALTTLGDTLANELGIDFTPPKDDKEGTTP